MVASLLLITIGIGKDRNYLGKTVNQRLFYAQGLAHSNLEQDNHHMNSRWSRN